MTSLCMQIFGLNAIYLFYSLLIASGWWEMLFAFMFNVCEVFGKCDWEGGIDEGLECHDGRS